MRCERPAADFAEAAARSGAVLRLMSNRKGCGGVEGSGVEAYIVSGICACPCDCSMRARCSAPDPGGLRRAPLPLAQHRSAHRVLRDRRLRTHRPPPAPPAASIALGKYGEWASPS